MNKKIIIILSCIVVIALIISAIWYAMDANIIYKKNEENFSNNLINSFKDNKTQKNDTNLNDYISFDYDKVYVFEPYEDKSRMEEKLGFKFSALKESFSEDQQNIVFVKDNEVVCYISGSTNKLGYYINIPTGVYTKQDISGFNFFTQKNKADNSNETYIYCSIAEEFIATVLESGDTLLVAPDENESEYKSSDKISMVNISNIELKEGMKVVVTYDGVMLETSPAQIIPLDISLYNKQ